MAAFFFLLSKDLDEVTGIVSNHGVSPFVRSCREWPEGNWNISRFEQRESLIEIIYDDSGFEHPVDERIVLRRGGFARRRRVVMLNQLDDESAALEHGDGGLVPLGLLHHDLQSQLLRVPLGARLNVCHVQCKESSGGGEDRWFGCWSGGLFRYHWRERQPQQ